VPSSQPSVVPTSQPSGVPSSQPSSIPTGQPSSLPSSQPSKQPSGVPTSQPSCIPTGQPSSVPSSQPSVVPTSQPSGVPSSQPSSIPTGQPSSVPSSQPSVVPTSQPSGVPSSQPSSIPSGQPSNVPSSQPSVVPTSQPSGVPSSQPSSIPTGQPASVPSGLPSVVPATQPSGVPRSQPSSNPTAQPSSVPSSQPSVVPTSQPSSQPSGVPISRRSPVPSFHPTWSPTALTSIPAASNSSFVYNSLEFKGYFAYGGCSQFHAFFTFDIPTASSLHSTFDGLLITVAYGLQNSMYTAECESANEVQTFMDILVSGASGSTASVSCNGRVWTSKICPFDSSPALCVDCGDPCSVTARSQSPLVINPCQVVSNFPVSTFLEIKATNRNGAPQIFSLVVIPSKNSFVVDLELSEDGIVYCGVDSFQDGVNSNEDITVQGFQRETIARKASIGILGLVPGTEYEVYCLTMSYSGEQSSFELVSAKNKQIMSTSCCKPIVGSLLSSGPHRSISSSSEDRFPLPIEAMRTTDGGIVVAIPFETDISVFTRVFPCIRVFPGIIATCQWINSRILYLLPTNELIGRFQLNFESNNCKKRTICTKSRTTVVISTEEMLSAAPEIDIGAPSVVSPGTPLYLDLTHSTNNYGRPWSRIEIGVYKNGNHTELYELSGKELLNQFPVYIPDEMSENTDFLFLVTMCNTMNMCSTRPHQVKVVERSIGPMIRILGPSFRKNINPSSFMNIMAASPSDVEYSWKLTRNQMTERGSAVNRFYNSFIRFLPVSLFPNTLYKLTVFGHEVNTPTSKLSQYSQFITVKEMSLVAKIEGGNYQVYEAGAQVILKGESSIIGDLDISYYQGSVGGLSFEWQCFNEYPEVTSGCSLVMDSSIDLDHVTFHSSLRDANKTFGIMLKIVDTQGRMAVDQVRVHLIEPRSSPVMKFLGSIVQIRNRRRFAVEVGFPFHNTRSGKVQWSLNNSLIDLSDSKISKTFSAQNISVSEETRKYYFDLALTPISAHSLLSFYSTLQLSFICSFGSSSTVITATFPINQAPQEGSLQINPKIGKSLKTIFQMTAMDWTDVDLPLYYEFKYQIQGFTYSLQMKSEQSFLFTYLMIPETTIHCNATIVLDVYDSLNAKNSVSEEVVLSSELGQPRSELSVDFLDFTGKAKQTGSIEEMASLFQLSFSPELQYLGAAIATLNSNDFSNSLVDWHNSTTSFVDFILQWKNNSVVHHSNCSGCLYNCQRREELIRVLFNVSTSTFVEENTIVQWINLLQNIVAPFSEKEAMIGQQGRKQGMKLLSYYLSQLLVMSSSFETIFDDISVDVFRIIDSFYQSTLREMTCSSVESNSSLLLTEWKAEVLPVLEIVTKIGFNDFLPEMNDLRALLIRERTFLSSFRTNDISVTDPLSVSSFDDTKITLTIGSRNASSFHLAVFSNAWGIRDANQSTYPLMIGIQDSNRYCENRDDRSCLLKLEFKNIERVKYLLPRKQSHVIQCHYHQAKVVTVNCAGNFLDNDELTVRCDGTYQGMINVTCPHKQSYPVCLLTTRDGSASHNEDSSHRICAGQATDERKTVCSCPLNSIFSELSSISVQQPNRPSFSFFEVTVTKEFQEVPQQLVYLPYNREDGVNPSEYPFFMMTVRSWLTIRNLSWPNNTSEDRRLLSTVNSSSVRGLQLQEQQLIASALQTTIEENYLFVVDHIYYVNSTLIALNNNQFALVVLIEVNVNVSDYCFYDNALKKIQDQIGERLINKTNLFSNRNPVWNEQENDSSLINGSDLLNGIITMTYTRLMRVFTIPSESSYCDAFVPTQQPTASPTTLPGQSSLNSNRNSLNAFSELSSRPDISAIFILVLIVFLIGNLVYLILSNREKPLLKSFFGDHKSRLANSSTDKKEEYDDDAYDRITRNQRNRKTKKKSVLQVGQLIPESGNSSHPNHHYYNTTALPEGPPSFSFSSSANNNGFVDQQINFTSHPMDFYHDPTAMMYSDPNYYYHNNYFGGGGGGGDYPGTLAVSPADFGMNGVYPFPEGLPPTDQVMVDHINQWTIPPPVNGNTEIDSINHQFPPNFPAPGTNNHNDNSNQIYNAYNPYSYDEYNWNYNNNFYPEQNNGPHQQVSGLYPPSEEGKQEEQRPNQPLTNQEMINKYKPVFGQQQQEQQQQEEQQTEEEQPKELVTTVSQHKQEGIVNKYKPLFPENFTQRRQEELRRTEKWEQQPQSQTTEVVNKYKPQKLQELQTKQTNEQQKEWEQTRIPPTEVTINNKYKPIFPDNFSLRQKLQEQQAVQRFEQQSTAPSTEATVNKYKPIFPKDFQFPPSSKQQLLQTPVGNNKNNHKQHFILPENGATPITPVSLNSNNKQRRSLSIQSLKNSSSMLFSNAMMNHSNNNHPYSHNNKSTTSNNNNNNNMKTEEKTKKLSADRQAFVESYFMTTVDDDDDSEEEHDH
jgi:hypothetical protein